MGVRIEQKKITQQKNTDDISFLKKEIQLFPEKLSNATKAVFYTELSVLLEAGVNLLESLKMVRLQFKKKKEQKIVNTIVEQLIQGKTLYESMQAQEKIFSNYELTSVQIGEETGRLKEVFEKIGDYYQKKNAQKKQIINAITYPVIVFITAFGAVTFMLKFVVPMFADVFKQNNVELPFITKKVIQLSGFVEDYLMLIVLILISGIMIYIRLLKTPKFKKVNDDFVYRIPFIGAFILKNQTLVFTQAMTLLLSANVPLLYAIQLTEGMLSFVPLKTSLENMEQKLIQGLSFYHTINEEKIFDAKLKSLLKVADETNNTLYAFENISTQYANDLDQQAKNLGTIMEPLIIVVLGGFVGIILVAMYLPMFKLSTVIG